MKLVGLVNNYSNKYLKFKELSRLKSLHELRNFQGFFKPAHAVNLIIVIIIIIYKQLIGCDLPMWPADNCSKVMLMGIAV